MWFGQFDDEIWNEHQWEAHINELERKSDQLRKFIAPRTSDGYPRWVALLRESTSELDAVDAYIEEELSFDEAYFPDEDDWDDEDDEFDDDDWLFDSDEFLEDDEWEDLDDEDFDEFDEGESWKSLSEEYTTSDYGSIENLDIYNDARTFGATVLRWVDSIPRRFHTNNLYRFVEESLKIGAKLATGYSFGFEQEMLGGNIVFNKKALGHANTAMGLFQDMKKASYMTRREYYYLHERLFDLRNEIGLYVQELRERFEQGFD